MNGRFLLPRKPLLGVVRSSCCSFFLKAAVPQCWKKKFKTKMRPYNRDIFYIKYQHCRSIYFYPIVSNNKYNNLLKGNIGSFKLSILFNFIVSLKTSVKCAMSYMYKVQIGR